MIAMDTISYSTRKHCRNILNILCTLLLAAMAAVAFVCLPVSAKSIALGVGCAALTVLTVVHMTGKPIGCTLLQILMGIGSFASFFAAIACSAVGFLVVRMPAVESDVHAFIESMGISLICTPHPSGAPLALMGLTFFFLSAAFFSAVSYLATVKSCLNDVITRQGARFFSICAFLLFAAVAAIAALRALGSSADAVALELGLLAVTVLLAGLSANAFVRATYAFKVFEDKVMKVETNADGTMYVPIREDSESTAPPVPVPMPRVVGADDKKKPRIKVYTAREELPQIDGSCNEYDIL